MTEIAKTPETPAEALRRLMAEQRLSTRGLVAAAEAAGLKLPQSAVAQLSTGKQAFTLPTAQACAAVFDVSPALFLPELAAIVRPVPGEAAVPRGTEARIPLEQLHPSPLNPRRSFDEAAVAGLAESIAAQGLLQNLVVRRTAEAAEGFEIVEGYWIVAGERRFRALCRLNADGRLPADLAEGVPCRIVDVDDATHIAIALLENLQRHDVNPMEEAEGFAKLQALDPEKWQTDTIAAAIGMSRRHVQLRLALCSRLTDGAKSALLAGKINLAQARVLTRAPAATQASVLKSVEKGQIRDAADVARQLEDVNIPASRALFDQALYDGASITDAETGELFFQDHAEFQRLQRDAVKAKAAELRAAGTSLVEIFTDKDWWTPTSYDAREARIEKAAKTLPPGAQSYAAIALQRDGSVTIFDKLMQLPKPPKPGKVPVAADGPVDPVLAVADGRKIYAMHAKSRALQAALFHGPREIYEALAAALIHGQGMMAIRTSDRGQDNRVFAPVIVECLDRFRGRLPESVKCGGFYLEASPYADETTRAAIDAALAVLAEAELQELIYALLASRCTSHHHYAPWLGDDPDARKAAEDLEIDMAKHWRIDMAYLATLKRDQLVDLHADLQLTRFGLLPAQFGKLKVQEMRAAILRHVEAKDLRFVPPELEFGSTKDIERDIRTAARARDGGTSVRNAAAAKAVAERAASDPAAEIDAEEDEPDRVYDGLAEDAA